MEKERPMKWYNACKVIMLVLGIFGVMGCMVAVSTFIFMGISADYITDEINLVMTSMSTYMGGWCVIYIVFTVMFFALIGRSKTAEKQRFI